MMSRELGEVINHAIAAYKKDMPVEKIFLATPTDANGYMAAYIERAIAHHLGTALREAAEDKGDDAKDAQRYRYLRSGVGRDHKHHTQSCIDVVICDWGRNLGRTDINAGVWSSAPILGARLDAAIDAQIKREG